MTNLPLQGKRILITRAKEQAGVLAERLRALGAEPVEFPTIAIAPLEDFSLLDRAIKRLAASSYDWAIFTSTNGVRLFCERLKALGYEAQLLSRVKLGAIGPATAEALAQHDLTVRYMPTRYVAEELAAGLGDVSGQRILLPRADIARKQLAQALRAKGASVDEVAVYRTLPAGSKATELKDLLRNGQIDLITFTSASTVRHFVQFLDGIDLAQVLSEVKVACIGPVTAKVAKELGIEAHIVAAEHTIDGLVRAIVEEVRCHA
ncbi:MAG: uroporphyrinogen-III synthase [Candidatus Bipolaricaulia bacterium]